MVTLSSDRLILARLLSTETYMRSPWNILGTLSSPNISCTQQVRWCREMGTYLYKPTLFYLSNFTIRFQSHNLTDVYSMTKIISKNYTVIHAINLS
jgi:hypothetical protein